MCTRYTRSHRLAVTMLSGVITVSCLLSTGCGRKLSARNLAVDPDLAIESLEVFLQAWKDGADIATLQTRQPAIHGADDAWQRGAKLVDFRILPHAYNDGTNLHISADLQLAGRERRSRSKVVVTYVVGTSPIITVFRQ